ncbi:hypothetical protein ACFWOG_04775 [Kitasatospora sp. NPDC058406]|uniref:hypothetical protein n=1 Tax=Kitasatospora sp. NPDC058406 TaxID=3346483 RepID=UPI0036465A03
MTVDGRWFVLVEESYEGRTDDGGTSWRLGRQEEAGTFEQAREAAVETARTFRPGGWLGDHWNPHHGRRIYQLTDRSWLVEVTQGHQRRTFRVTLGNLVEVVAETEPAPVAAPRRKGLFGRAQGS